MRKKKKPLSDKARNTLFQIGVLFVGLSIALFVQYIHNKNKPIVFYEVNYNSEDGYYSESAKELDQDRDLPGYFLEGSSSTTTEYVYETGGSEVLTEKSINLNTADSEELQKLPGIGPALAERIIAYREDFGEFDSVNEIVEIDGIGAKTLEKIKPYIYV